MLEWADDLKIRDCDLYLDSRQSRGQCFVSHAHSDHIGVHTETIATQPTAALLKLRLGAQTTTELPFGVPHHIYPDTVVALRSAGHILGSAMLHLQTLQESLLYTGDFKLRSCLT